MNPVRKQSLKFFALALAAAIVMFLLIFIGHLDHYLAIGGALIALVAFFRFFNRAWALWERSGAVAEIPATPEASAGKVAVDG